MSDANQPVPQNHIHSKLFAHALLHAIAGKLSEVFDKFSSWLFIGYGGAVTFLITNGDELKNNLPPEALRDAVQLLLPVAVFAIVAKFLAAVVGGGSAGAAVGREIGKDFDNVGARPDGRMILAEFRAALLQPGRWLVMRAFAKMEEGDLAFSGRRIYRIAQVQGFLTVAQAGCVLYAIYQLAVNVKFPG